MKKRNTLLAVFGILVFLSVIYFLPVANGYNYIFIDAEDDVYQYCDSTDETDIGDYHDEIDIVKLNITGKYVSFTVVGNISDWDSQHYAVIIFSSHFTYNGPHEGLSWRSPFYLINYESPSFASLKKCYRLGGDGYVYEVWNGTAWEDMDTGTAANILSESSQHSIIAYIPDAVEEIPNDMKCILKTDVIPWFIPSDCWYEDIAPAPSTGGDNIAGYNLFILICVMIGISIFIVRKRNKLK